MRVLYAPAPVPVLDADAPGTNFLQREFPLQRPLLQAQDPVAQVPCPVGVAMTESGHRVDSLPPGVGRVLVHLVLPDVVSVTTGGYAPAAGVVLADDALGEDIALPGVVPPGKDCSRGPGDPLVPVVPAESEGLGWDECACPVGQVIDDGLDPAGRDLFADGEDPPCEVVGIAPHYLNLDHPEVVSAEVPILQVEDGHCFAALEGKGPRDGEVE